MPKIFYSETQNLLDEHIKDLKRRLAALEGDKEVLLKALEQAERAFATITKRKPKYIYTAKSTFRQKIIFCLKSKDKILSVNDMVDILTKLDSDLANDTLNTAKSLRVQIRRMLLEGKLAEVNHENMKNLHYCLMEWLDENGHLKEEYC